MGGLSTFRLGAPCSKAHSHHWQRSYKRGLLMIDQQGHYTVANCWQGKGQPMRHISIAPYWHLESCTRAGMPQVYDCNHKPTTVLGSAHIHTQNNGAHGTRTSTSSLERLRHASSSACRPVCRAVAPPHSHTSWSQRYST